MVGGAGDASQGSREQGLAVSADGWHEGALGEHGEHGPGLSGGSGVAPGGRPAQRVRQEVAVAADRGNTETRAPDGAPSAINEGGVAIPSDVVAPSVMLRQGDDPVEGPVRLEGRGSNLDRQQAVQLEVSQSLRGEVWSQCLWSLPLRWVVEMRTLPCFP